MTDTEMATLTGAYATNALTERETAEFERHLAGCDDCAQEVRELQETAAQLGASTATTPPESLKQRVMTEISRTRQDPPHTPEKAGGPSEPTPLRRARRMPVSARLTAAAAVVGIAAAAAFGAMAWQAEQQLDRAQQRLERTGDRGTAMSELLRANDARIVTASSHGMRATAVLSHELDRAMFMSTGIEQPPPGRTYQVWFIGPGGATSAGLIEQDSAGNMTPIMAPMPPETRAMGITLEPAGGSPQPTTDPMFTMKMPT